MNKIKKKFKLISTGLQSHISDIWSALDVANLIVIAIAIFDWILNNVTASVLNKLLSSYFNIMIILRPNQMTITVFFQYQTLNKLMIYA